MNSPIDFSRQIAISRNLLEQALSGMEQLVTLGIDHTQDFVGRSSQHLKSNLSDPAIVVEASAWPDAMQQGIHAAVNMARDTTLSATDFQIDAMRLLRNQASEIQKTLADAISEQFANVEKTAGAAARSSKTSAVARRVSA